MNSSLNRRAHCMKFLCLLVILLNWKLNGRFGRSNRGWNDGLLFGASILAPPTVQTSANSPSMSDLPHTGHENTLHHLTHQSLQALPCALHQECLCDKAELILLNFSKGNIILTLIRYDYRCFFFFFSMLELSCTKLLHWAFWAQFCNQVLPNNAVRSCLVVFILVGWYVWKPLPNVGWFRQSNTTLAAAIYWMYLF